MNFIKQIFGFSSEASKNQRCDGTQRQHYQYAPNSEDEEATSSRFPSKRDECWNPEFYDISETLDVHQYFEYHLNEMLKFFGLQQSANDLFSKFYNDVGHAMDEEFIHNEQESVNDLREQFLKDGYKKPSQKHIQKVDEDIGESGDHVIDLNTIFGPNGRDSPENIFDGFFFGRSQQIHKIMDESIETTTIRDIDGNEEETVCRIIQGKKYCITKKRDKFGNETIITKNVENVNDQE